MPLSNPAGFIVPADVKTEISPGDYILMVDTAGIVYKITRSDFLKPPNTTQLTYQTDGDINGLFYWIGTDALSQPWTNPHSSGKIAVTMSSVYNADHNNPQYLVDRSLSSAIATQNSADSFYKVDLKNYRLQVNRYSLRARDYPTANPRNWQLSGSNNDIDYTVIDSQVNQNLAQNQWFTGGINNQNSSYKYFKITETGVNSSGDYVFCIGEFELYGIVSPISN